jgi:hypothetical protein
VIYESAYWKGDLLRRSSILRNYLVQRRWPEASFAKCEQTVMVGFYSIRKLIEATKLTDVLTKTPVPLVRYPSKGRPVTRINRHEVGELYDFNSSEKLNLSLVELCHQFIHSYVFVPVLREEGGLSAFWLASDRQRSRAILEIGARRVISIFEKVGKDETRSTRMEFDDSIRDYRVHNT